MLQPLDPLHHRSKSEIKKWLKKRDWYKKYVNNLKTEYQDINQVQAFLLGEKESSTISAAFCYSETPEGVDFWLKQEELFLTWYFYQE